MITAEKLDGDRKSRISGLRISYIRRQATLQWETSDSTDAIGTTYWSTRLLSVEEK